MTLEEANKNINRVVYNKAMEIYGVIDGIDSKTKSILIVYNNYYPAIPTNPGDLVLTNKRKEDIV